jgi:hypothetical protein
MDFYFLKIESEAESKQSGLKAAQVMVIILSPLITCFSLSAHTPKKCDDIRSDNA